MVVIFELVEQQDPYWIGPVEIDHKEILRFTTTEFEPPKYIRINQQKIANLVDTSTRISNLENMERQPDRMFPDTEIYIICKFAISPE